MIWEVVRILFYFSVLLGYILFGTMFFVGFWLYWKEKHK